MTTPGDGWRAFFVQMIYPVPDELLEEEGVDYGFSTQVVVTPNRYPYLAP